MKIISHAVLMTHGLQCFDAVGWVAITSKILMLRGEKLWDRFLVTLLILSTIIWFLYCFPRQCLFWCLV